MKDLFTCDVIKGVVDPWAISAYSIVAHGLVADERQIRNNVIVVTVNGAIKSAKRKTHTL